MSSNHDKRMIQYLLGQLPEAECAELEARYFAEGSLFQELLALEAELRDAYVRGELSRRDREDFEKHLLGRDSQRQQQEFSEALRNHLLRCPISSTTVISAAAGWKPFLQQLGKRRVWLVPAVSLSFLILLSAAWWLTRHSGYQRASAPTHNLPADERPAPVNAGQSGPTNAQTVAFVLNPVLLRGVHSTPPLIIPPTATQVRLEARFDADYPSYEAVLRTAENTMISSQKGLQAEAFRSGKRITVDLPSSLLQPADYILTVNGVPSTGHSVTVAEYAFCIARR
jgi:hypothetical protein